MSAMRAKMQIQSVTSYETCEEIKLAAVCGKAPFGKDGESEDNTYARYTPNGSLSLTINNPSLRGRFKTGQKFYLDFTEAAE